MSAATELQAKVSADRRALQDALSELRGKLSPAALTDDIGTNLSSRVSAAGHAIGDRASSPAGLVALCAMAFSTAFALGGGMKREPTDSDALVSTKPAVMPPAPSRDMLAMLAQLSAAIAAGAVASRYLPVTQAERDLLSGVGPELKTLLQGQIEAQAHRLVAPRTERFGLINLLALGGALLMSRRR